MKIKFILFILGFYFLCSCGTKSTVDKQQQPQEASSNESVSTIKTVRYFKGGFFPPPDQPAWSDDLEIQFDSNGTANIHGRHFDKFCFKWGGLSAAQTSDLIERINELQVSVQTVGMSRTIDAGVEYIEIKLANSEVKKIHLLQLDLHVGENLASNGSDLAIHLRKISDQLSTNCKIF
jgi:hypothetical protein